MSEEAPKGLVEFVRLYFDKEDGELRLRLVGTFDMGNGTDESWNEAWDKHIDPLLSNDLKKGVDSWYYRKDQVEQLFSDLDLLFSVNEEEDE